MGRSNLSYNDDINTVNMKSEIRNDSKIISF